MEKENLLKKLEINESLNEDELIRRLKQISESLQSTSQDENLNDRFQALAGTLSEDFCISHPSKNVQMLVACCIADILRIFAPEAPYRNADQIKTIFMFLIKQLQGLMNVENKSYTRHFYLLENLAYVKSFNMCFEIEDNQEVFIELFQLFFNVINIEKNEKIRAYMLDIMIPLLTESDTVSFELLDIFLRYLIEPQKSKHICAYALAKDLIKKTSEALTPYFQSFLSQELLMKERHERTYQSTSSRIFDLIYELFSIAPASIYPILPHLECKLQSKDENDRLKTIDLLSKMFSESSSELIEKYPQLWKQFKARFADISRVIRKKCIQSTKSFLLSHENLREEIIELLRARYRDPDENVRFELVLVLVELAKQDWRLVASTQLLEFIKERVMDMKFRIRKEALTGFSIVYKSYMTAVEQKEVIADPLRKAADMIKNKILHGYYMTSVEDKILIERLVITCLIPYQMPTEIRMKILYQLLATIDEHATRAFIELQKHQIKLRKLVLDWVRCHKRDIADPAVKKEVIMRVNGIAKQLPEPVKAQELLAKFSGHMRRDQQIIRDMETILRGNGVSCRDCTDTMQSLLRKLGSPSPTNYHNTIKLVLNRVASVIVDSASIDEILNLIEKCLEVENASSLEHEAEDIADEVIPGLSNSIAGERGVRLLTVLAQVFGYHFQNESTLKKMTSLMSINHPRVGENVLKAFSHLGASKPLIESFPTVLRTLVQLCRDYAMSGTPKQCKEAIRCMFVNTQSQHNNNVNEFDIFDDIINSLEKSLEQENEHFRTAIVSLGQISLNMPERFRKQISSLIARKIVRKLLLYDVPENRDDVPTGDWCNEDQLPEFIRCMLAGSKTMAQWIIGLKTDVASAQRTLKIFIALITTGGDIQESHRLSGAEKSWLRLTAAKSVLKICEQKGVGDCLTGEQFLHLAQFITDETKEVREFFLKRLHKGLSRGLLDNSLPLDFMGIYVLGGREKNSQILEMLKGFVQDDINLRRKYIKSCKNVDKTSSNLSNIYPDYMLVYAIAILAHDPKFTDPTDIRDLEQIEKSLLLIMNPLMNSEEFYCHSFYEQILQRIKLHKSALRSEDDITNQKMWVCAEMALNLLKPPISSNIENPHAQFMEARLPSMFFQKQPDDFSNEKRCLPEKFLGSFINDAVVASQARRKRSPSNSSFNSNESDGDSNMNGDDEPPIKRR